MQDDQETASRMSDESKKERNDEIEEMKQKLTDMTVKELDLENDIMQKDQMIGRYGVGGAKLVVMSYFGHESLDFCKTHFDPLSQSAKNRELRENIEKMTMESERIENHNRVLALELKRTKDRENELNSDLQRQKDENLQIQKEKFALDKINASMQNKLTQEKLLKDSLIKKVETLYQENATNNSKNHRGLKEALSGLLVIGGHRRVNTAARLDKESSSAMKRKDLEIRKLNEQIQRLMEAKKEQKDAHNKELEHFNRKNDQLEFENEKLKKEIEDLRPITQPRQTLKTQAWLSIDSNKLNSKTGSSIATGNLGADALGSSPSLNKPITSMRKTVRKKPENLNFISVYGELDNNDKVFRLYKNELRLDICTFYQIKYVKHVKEVTQNELRKYRQNFDSSIKRMFQIVYDDNMNLPEQIYFMANDENECKLWVEKIRSNVEYSNKNISVVRSGSKVLSNLHSHRSNASDSSSSSRAHLSTPIEE